MADGATGGTTGSAAGGAAGCAAGGATGSVAGDTGCTVSSAAGVAGGTTGSAAGDAAGSTAADAVLDATLSGGAGPWAILAVDCHPSGWVVVVGTDAVLRGVSLGGESPIVIGRCAVMRLRYFDLSAGS